MVSYMSHPLFQTDENALQIIGYYEVEVVNPIGSYVSTHKLGCLYFTIANIRPQYRSSFKSYQSCCCGTAQTYVSMELIHF